MTMLDIRFLVCLQLVRLACSLMDKERRKIEAQTFVALMMKLPQPKSCKTFAQYGPGIQDGRRRRV